MNSDIIAKRGMTMKKRNKIIIAILVAVIAALGIATGIYANDYYRAVDVDEYIMSSKTVTVSQIDEGYFFDGPGEDKALIFYPGAKVEETAYAPIMKSLAEQGVDCFLIKMPMKLAIFGASKADDIRAKYDYENYYLAGHSLGGAMAANYATEHLNDYSGLFLLAAYPTKDLTKARFPIVLLYGDNDKVLNREKLEVGFTLVPSDYKKVEIAGGNHAQFGSYGAQNGDGEATITPEEQWQITVNTIIKKIEQ